MATRSEIAGRVQRDLKRVGIDSTQVTDINVWINQAIREDLELEYNWPCMFTEQTDLTQQGMDDYQPQNAPPNLLKEIVWVRFRQSPNDEWAELDELDLRGLYHSFGEQSEGVPQCWAQVSNDTIKIRPIPDASTYYLNFGEFMYLNDFATSASGDNSTNYFTSNHPRLVEWATVRRGLMFYGELQTYQLWDQIYQVELAKTIRHTKIAHSKAHGVLGQSDAAGQPANNTRVMRAYTSRSPYDWV